MPAAALFPSLAERPVVITGGGSGIGAEIVRAFVRQKSRVFFLDVAEAESHALVAELGGAAQFVKCDLTDLEALQAAMQAIEKQVGAVAALINNAANDDRHE